MYTIKCLYRFPYELNAHIKSCDEYGIKIIHKHIPYKVQKILFNQSKILPSRYAELNKRTAGRSHKVTN